MCGAGKERERKVLTGGVGLSAGEAGRARDERVARRSGPDERVWGERRGCIWAERDVVLAG